MKRVLVLSLLAALLGGCVVVPLGYYRGDGYHRGYGYRGYDGYGRYGDRDRGG